MFRRTLPLARFEGRGLHALAIDLVSGLKTSGQIIVVEKLLILGLEQGIAMQHVSNYRKIFLIALQPS